MKLLMLHLFLIKLRRGVSCILVPSYVLLVVVFGAKLYSIQSHISQRQKKRKINNKSVSVNILRRLPTYITDDNRSKIQKY